MNGIKLVLTAANMGTECDEADFDAWTRFVCDHIDEAVGFKVHEVDQFRFGYGPDCDNVTGATEPQEDAILLWLKYEGWDDFCSTPEAWPKKEEVA